jgi:ADP-heptose:LPS heptosyltransferase
MVDAVIEAPVPWISADPERISPVAAGRLIDRLAAEGADRAIISTSWHQSPLPMALLLRMAGVARVDAISDDYAGSLLDLRHRVSDRIHEVERALSLVNAAGFKLPSRDRGHLQVRRTDRTAAEPIVQFPRRSYVVVHPGTLSPSRSWAADRHAEVVRMLSDLRWNVVVTGSPGEVALTSRVAGRARRTVDIGGRTSLACLAEVIANAAVIVSGNTGPAHLAAAVGTPVVCIYAPTVPAERWRPWRVRHELLNTRNECPGCSSAVCSVSGHPCIDDVSAAEAVEAVMRLADGSRRNKAVAA